MRNIDVTSPHRAVLLRIGHACSMLAATAALIVAATQPLEAGGGSFDTPGESFVVAAVLAGVLTLASTWQVLRARPLGWRRGIVLVAAATLNGLLVWWKMPEPGYYHGIGLAAPWALLGCGLLALAGLLLTLPWSGRDVRVRAAGTRVPVLAAVVVAAVAGLLAVSLPAVVEAANTDATTTAHKPPAPRAPRLDGTRAWEVDSRANPPKTGRNQDMTATAGGLLVARPSGVRMLDARTGDERWHRYRYDWRYGGYRKTYFRGPDHGREWKDSDLVTADDGKIAAVNMVREIDGEEAEDQVRTWVLDTVSGRLLGTISGDRTVVIASGLVLSTDEVYDPYSEVYRDTSGRIVARTPSGERRWEHSLPEDCELDEAYSAPGDLIVASVRCDIANTDARSRVLALRAGTGALAWRWNLPEEGRATIRPAPEKHEDSLLVHVRIGDNRHSEQSVFALDISNGKARWKRENIELQHDSPGEANGDDLYWASIAWAGSTPVIAEVELTESRFVVVGLDPSTGDTTWSRTLPEHWSVPYGITENPRLNGPILGLPDGRLLVAGVREPDILEYDGLAIIAMNAGTGTTTTKTVLPDPMFEREFRLLRTPATVVATSKGNAVALR